MEGVISNLVQRFEAGTLSRRELIYGLTLLAGTGASAAAAAQQQTGFKATKIDHISIQVADLPRSVAFYQSVFGLAVVGEDKPNEIVRLGTTKALVSLHHKAPTGLIDHFAIGIEGFDKELATKELQRRGLTPEKNLDAGFHVKDPEGMRVQIVAG